CGWGRRSLADLHPNSSASGIPVNPTRDPVGVAFAGRSPFAPRKATNGTTTRDQGAAAPAKMRKAHRGKPVGQLSRQSAVGQLSGPGNLGAVGAVAAPLR